MGNSSLKLMCVCVCNKLLWSCNIIYNKKKEKEKLEIIRLLNVAVVSLLLLKE